MNRIKELRKAHGYSQEKLANTLHVHQTAISQWENDKTNPDFENLIAMSALFGVTVDYILGNETEQKEENDSDLQEYISLFDELNDKGKRLVLDMLRSVYKNDDYRKREYTKEAM